MCPSWCAALASATEELEMSGKKCSVACVAAVSGKKAAKLVAQA